MSTGPTGPWPLFPLAASWSLLLNNALTATPALKDARGYFPIEGDRVVKYDIEHGTLLWIFSAHVESQPAIGEGLVFLREPEAVTAVHEETGNLAWRVPFAEDPAAPLVWNNGWLITTTASGSVLALRGSDGGLIWRRELGGPFHAPAALGDNRVYLPMADGRVVALRVETGEQLWERRLGGPANEILPVDDRLFLGSNDRYFYAIHAETGEILWRWATGGYVVGLPVVDRQRVYFVSFDNVLRGLDRHTGAQRWKRGLPVRPTRGVVAMDELLIVSGLSATSPAYLAKDGTSAGVITVEEGELAAAPHVVPSTLLPTLVLVTKTIANGTVVRSLTRDPEPKILPIAPLPNPIVPPIPPAWRIPIISIEDVIPLMPAEPPTPPLEP